MNSSHGLPLRRGDKLPILGKRTVAASTKQEWIFVWSGQHCGRIKTSGPTFKILDATMNRPLSVIQPLGLCFLECLADDPACTPRRLVRSRSSC